MKGDWSIKSQEEHLIRSTEAQKMLGSFIYIRASQAISKYGNIHSIGQEVVNDKISGL